MIACVLTKNRPLFYGHCMRSILTAEPAFSGVVVIDNSDKEWYAEESKADLCEMYNFDKARFVVRVETGSLCLGLLRSRLVSTAMQVGPGQPLVEVDDDDSVMSGIVAQMIRGFRKGEVVVGDFMKVLQAKDGSVERIDRATKVQYTKPYYKCGNIGCGIRGFTPAAYQAVGGYDELLVHHEDYDLMKRFELADFFIEYMPEVFGLVTYHGDSVRNREAATF